jgi:hypothetical protein
MRPIGFKPAFLATSSKRFGFAHGEASAGFATQISLRTLQPRDISYMPRYDAYLPSFYEARTGKSQIGSFGYLPRGRVARVVDKIFKD